MNNIVLAVLQGVVVMAVAPFFSCLLYTSDAADD